jgi:hypothetical protein
MVDLPGESVTIGRMTGTRRSRTARKRDGSTPELAIVEDQWVWRRRNCPDATVLLQKLIGRNGKYFDELTLRSADEMRVVYFDVSDVFGKRRGL